MGTRDYSTTAASNLSVQGISLAEGMARAAVNNGMRAQLADIADLLLDLGGATITTGTASAYLIALDTAPTAYADNLLFLATAHVTNAATPTINVNGLGTKDIKKMLAGSAVAIGTSDFQEGQIGIFTYSSANNCFLMLNPGTSLPVGAESVAFETRATAAAAATAGTIPDSLAVIEVLGHTTPGDDAVASYTREVAAFPVGDSFVDADGSWWVERAQGLQRIDGVATLRTYAPIDGRNVYLAYHTTAGDLGSGQFCGATGASAGTFVDNDGTIIVPTGGDGSTAWLRVWDGITAHVGWFGAVCDRVTDDYIPVKKCLDLFTDGRVAFRIGVIDVGPGFAFGTPLIYGASDNGKGITLRGRVGRTRGAFTDASTLYYIGPATLGAIIFLAAFQAGVEDLNVAPGLAYNGIICTASNTYNTALTASVTAGTNVVASVATTTGLRVGVFIPVDAGGANFEIVVVKVVNSATTFTADFAKNHANGAQAGGTGSPSGWHFNRCRLMSPESTIWTTLAVLPSAGVGTVFTPFSMAGIDVGMPLRIGSYGSSETVYVTAITGSTFTADSLQSHVIGDIVMYATAAVLFGNRLSTTVQVSEVSFNGVELATGGLVDRCYSGIRQVNGGNTKNFTMHDMKYTYTRIPFAFEDSSGIYVFSGVVGAGAYDTILLHATGSFTIIGLEDESLAYWVRCNVGSNFASTTFIEPHFAGAAPQTNDEVVWHSGQLTIIGGYLSNGRTFGTTYPVFIMLGITNPLLPTGLALINASLPFVGLSDSFIRNVSGGSGVDMVADGRYNITMIGCKGGDIGAAKVTLPTLLPPATRWQNTATYDPPDLTTGLVDTAQTMTVTGAVLGDLVDVSFSNDLNGAALRAWVSATNTVKYQFSNPGTGTIVLASGTVKCRVKK